MSPLQRALLAIAVAANLAVGWTAALQDRGLTYVFTPLVDVQPDSAILTEGEALQIREDLRHQVEARDIQQAYARLGSTMSVDDLVEGVAALDEAGLALDAGQRQRITRILDEAHQGHEDLYKVQVEILDLEAKLAAQMASTLAALPPESRQAFEAASQRPPPGPPPGGRR